MSTRSHHIAKHALISTALFAVLTLFALALSGGVATARPAHSTAHRKSVGCSHVAHRVAVRCPHASAKAKAKSKVSTNSTKSATSTSSTGAVVSAGSVKGAVSASSAKVTASSKRGSQKGTTWSKGSTTEGSKGTTTEGSKGTTTEGSKGSTTEGSKGTTTEGSGGTTGAGATPLIVPAYWEPEGTPNPWDTLCSDAPAGSIDIANPDNGPGKAKLNDYAEAVTYCNARAQKVIGYVYTEYGKRSLSTVEAQIADYYSWYPGVDGVFLDEMAEQPDEAYYATLEAYVHARGGIVVGNPGETVSTDWQLNDVDVVVTFEGSASEYASYRPSAWVASTASDRIANIVHGSSSLDCPLTGDAGYVYDTNLNEPNPYGSLPSYWLSESELC